MRVPTGFATDGLKSCACAAMHLATPAAMIDAPRKPITPTADRANAQHRAGEFKGFTMPCIMGKLPNSDKNKRVVETSLASTSVPNSDAAEGRARPDTAT